MSSGQAGRSRDAGAHARAPGVPATSSSGAASAVPAGRRAAHAQPGLSATASSAGTNYDHLIKLLVIGDSGVGKSCLLMRFCDDLFTPSFITTIGIDFIRTVDIDGKRIKLQIWDTAGQERFRTITTAYYRGAMGILLVYDVTDERSFNNIRNWIRNTEQFASDDVNMILVGNKCDMADKRAVDRERAEALAAEYGMAFMETSAKASIGVDDAFMTIARDIKKRLIDTRDKTEDAGSAGVTLAGSQDGTWVGRVQSSCCGGMAYSSQPADASGAHPSSPKIRVQDEDAS